MCRSLMCIAITLIFGGCCLVLISSGLTHETRARAAIEAAGLTHVIVKGYAFTGCDSGDTLRTRFSALNASGQVVHGVVCGSVLNGAVVRVKSGE